MKKRLSKKTLISVCTLIAALIIWTMWSNTALMLSTVTVSSNRIPAAFNGFRIAQISDLHNAVFGEDNDITLIGLSDPSFTLKGDMFGEVPAMVDTKLRGLIGDKDNYTILLSHRPELFEAYVNCGVDLVLSGHAHGGQFRLPFIGGLVAPNQGLFPKYDAGLYTKGDTNMIVCRGLGNSIIPIRFNNRPEIVLLELIAE